MSVERAATGGEAEHERIAADLAARLEEVDALDPASREVVYGVLDAVDALHRRAFRRLGETLDEDTLARLRGADAGLAWLLDAYGAGADQVSAVASALEHVRSRAGLGVGAVVALDVTDGVVRVEVAAGFGAELTAFLEEALAERVPGFAGMEVVERDRAAAPPEGVRLLPLAPRPK